MLKAHGFKLLGAALLLALLLGLDTREIAGAFGSFDYGYLPFILTCFFLSIVFKALRWRHLLALQETGYSLWRSQKVYHAAVFLSVVTPGKLGDLSKALYLKADLNLSVSRTMPSILVDRFFDLYFLLLSGFVGSLLLGRFVDNFVTLSITAALILSITFMVLSERLSRMALLCAQKLSPSRAQSTFHKFQVSLTDIQRKMKSLLPRQLVIPCLYSACAYCMIYLGSLSIARALGIPIGFLEIMYAISLTSIIALLPISVSGIGTRDVAMVAIFHSWGLLPEVGLAFSLAYLILNIIGANTLGAIFWFSDPPDMAIQKAAATPGEEA